MEALGGTASIIAVIDITAKISTACFEYYSVVKDAKEDIARLERKVKELESTAKDVQKLIDEDEERGKMLSTSRKLGSAVHDCVKYIESLEKKLQPSGTRKVMKKFGGRALKWPFEKKELDRILGEIAKCNSSISSALQVDQTRMIIDIRKKIDLDRLPSAAGAAFDANTGELDIRCHPDTRKEILNQISVWATDRQSKCMFWLKGMVGTGKSTISRTVAQSFADNHQLGASFFFKRGEGERGSATRFFTTIVSQLVHNVPEVISEVRCAIDKQPQISDKPLREQFEKLILEPLSQIQRDSKAPVVFVIDALDECDGERNIRDIIHLLSRLKELAFVRIFLTSRPELPIRLGFSTISSDAHEDFVLQDIQPTTIQHDIFIFLKEEFQKIRSEYNSNNPPEFLISTDWPSEENMEILAKISSPLFIFAATICRFVGDQWMWNPEDRLNSVLEHRSIGQDNASQLDQTYIPVLRQLEVGRNKSDLNRLAKMFRTTVGSIVVLADSLSVNTTAKILGISQRDLLGCLQSLHSVLSIPSDPELPIKLLHLSFREFLIDPGKKDSDFWFWVDGDQTHSNLMEKCLELLSTNLKQNMCSLEYDGMPRNNLTVDAINKNLLPETRYSGLYWVYHLEKSRMSIKNEGIVHKFLRLHILHWIEMLSLMGKTLECIGLISSICSLVDNTEGSDVGALLNDAKRFLLSNQHIIKEAPLQVYSSAIIFSPETSIIRNLFRDCIPKWIEKMPETPRSWGAELQKIEFATKGSIEAYALSIERSMLAIVSYRREIHIWDILTKEKIKCFPSQKEKCKALNFVNSDTQLVGITEDQKVWIYDIESACIHEKFDTSDIWCSPAAFSPDGEQLMITSSDEQTLEIWSVVTGKYERIVEEHATSICAIIISPRGDRIASTSRDYMIRIWDTETGKQLQKLHVNHSYITSLRFSDDGRLIAINGQKQGIEIWNVETGEHEQTLEVNCDNLALLFSSDGKRLVFAADHAIKVWDLTTGKEIGTFMGHSSWVPVLAFSADEKLLISASDDGTIRFWDMMLLETQDQTVNGLSWEIQRLALSHDGQLLASQTTNNVISILEIAGGKSRELYSSHYLGYSVMAFSLDGRLLAASDANEAVRIWNMETGELIWELIRTKPCIVNDIIHCIERLAFSPTKGELAVLSSSKSLSIWDITKSEAEQEAQIIDSVTEMAFSADGLYLALAFENRRDYIMMMDLSSGKTIDLTGNCYWPQGISVSPDNKTLASLCPLDEVSIWDVSTKQLLRKIKLQAGVRSICFSTDGQRLETPRGPIAISDSSPRYPSDGFYICSDWMTRDGKNVLWLPHEYRGATDFKGNRLVMAQNSGIGIIEFACDFK